MTTTSLPLFLTIITFPTYLFTSSLAQDSLQPSAVNSSAGILSPLICALSPSIGSCRGKIPRYYYDAETETCTTFHYGGCGGNGNNFETLRQCWDTCVTGLRYGAQREACENVKCPNGGTSHYRELGCKPVYDDGACCPTRFDCPDKSIQKNSTQCGYNGKLYNLGESIPEADTGCRDSCSCSYDGINCANVECPELFGYYPNENCQIGLYKRGDCCASEYACGNETQICEFEGKTYVEGEKMYPSEEPCLTCYCKPGFNGSLTSEFCEVVDCGIQIWYSRQLENGCAPVYYLDSKSRIGCCPISWHCPEAPSQAASHGNSSIQVNSVGKGSLLPTATTANNGTQTQQVSSALGQPITVVTRSVCYLPKETGGCQAARQRYFYNNETGLCEGFSYSGCEGNLNNFMSKKDCVQVCVSNQQGGDDGLLGRLAGVVKQVSVVLRSPKDPCTQEVKPGGCRAYFPRYFFNAATNRCQFFIYGGCNRNENNFYTVASCEATCLRSYPSSNACDKKPLDLIKNCGTQHLTKYYFEAAEGRCKQFTSTGCSSEAFFTQMEECESVCLPGSSSELSPVDNIDAPDHGNFCALPKKTGSCFARIPSFYFDTSSRTCKSFIYGGCFGNRNRFSSLESCRVTCETEHVKPVLPLFPASSSFQQQFNNNNNSTAEIPRYKMSIPKGQGESSNGSLVGNIKFESPSSDPKNAINPTEDTKQPTMHFPDSQEGTQDNNAHLVFTRSVGGQKQQQISEILPTATMTPQSLQDVVTADTVSSSEEQQQQKILEEDDIHDDDDTTEGLSIDPLESDEDDQNQSNVQDDSQDLLLQMKEPVEGFTKPFNTLEMKGNASEKEEGVQSYQIPILSEFSEKNHTTDELNLDELTLPENNSTVLVTNEINRTSSVNKENHKRTSSSTSTQDLCQQSLEPGSCNQTVLRFYWDGGECRPFNYTGCGGNENRFISEYECQRRCTTHFEDLSKRLSCLFGAEVIPFGAHLQAGGEECGKHFCSCSLPPSLTCTFSACVPRGNTQR